MKIYYSQVYEHFKCGITTTFGQKTGFELKSIHPTITNHHMWLVITVGCLKIARGLDFSFITSGRTTKNSTDLLLLATFTWVTFSISQFTHLHIVPLHQQLLNYL